jgi:sulfatase maturation enzyme AslB (radical SAM superfamily)
MDGYVTIVTTKNNSEHILDLVQQMSLRYISIELTNVCNLKCSVCWSQTPKLNHSRAAGYMTETLFRKVLEELKPANEYIVSLSYAGESTLHPQFQEFSKLASECCFAKLQLATNGTTLGTPEIYDTLLHCYSEVAVSIHKTPYQPKIINNLIRLNQENNCVEGAQYIDLRANIVAPEFTSGELYLIETVLRRNRIKIKKVNAITEDLQCNDEKTILYPACPSLYCYLAVLWNGDTLPCCHILSSGDWSLGNVTEQSLKEVFYGADYQRLRDGDQNGTPCLHCTVRR